LCVRAGRPLRSIATVIVSRRKSVAKAAESSLARSLELGRSLAQLSIAICN
jgi:hypothetical protein